MEQQKNIDSKVRHISDDDVMQQVLNVVIELRVNADNLESLLEQLKDDPDGRD